MQKKYLKTVLQYIITFSICFLFMVVPAYAEVTIDTSSATSGVKTIQNILYTVLEGIGDILMMFGVWKFGVSYTTDQAGEISRGTAALLGGALLANIKTLMGSV